MTPYVTNSLIPQVLGNNAVVFTWPFATNDVGQSINGPGFADKSFQVEGTFGGATVVIEGSNDGINYHTLNDPFGNALSLTAPALKQLTEIALYIRPNVAGGSGVSLAVIAVACSHQPNLS